MKALKTVTLETILLLHLLLAIKEMYMETAISNTILKNHKGLGVQILYMCISLLMANRFRIECF